MHVYIKASTSFLRKTRSLPPNWSWSLLTYVYVGQSNRILEAIMDTFMVYFTKVNVMKYGDLSSLRFSSYIAFSLPVLTQTDTVTEVNHIYFQIKKYTFKNINLLKF